MSGLFCENVLRQLGIFTEELLTGSLKGEQTLSSLTLRRTPPRCSIYPAAKMYLMKDTKCRIQQVICELFRLALGSLP